MTALTLPVQPTNADLLTVIVHKLDALPVSRDTWNALAQLSETNTIFQTYEWIKSWCDVFAQDAPLRILLFYAGEQLVGIAPLMIDAGGEGDRTLRFVGDTHADYCDILTGPHKRAVIGQLLNVLAEQRGDWDCLSLLNLPAGSTTLALLQELAPQHRLHLVLRGRVACPTIQLSDVADHGSAILAKQSLKRPYNYFRRQGNLQARHVVDFPTAEALFPLFFQQHIERWSATRTPSLFARDRNRAFYLKLLHELHPTGWLRFTVIELDERPIAFHMGFAYAGSFIWYKPAFDIRLRKHSPGALLLRFLLQQAIQEKCLEFDFTVGNEPFKRRYANAVRYNRNALLLTRCLPYLWARLTVGCKQVLKHVHRVIA